MIISGKARQNGTQLGRYLTAQGANENVTVLEVRGTASRDPARAVQEMSLRAELTQKGVKGLYHAHIAPAYGEDVMTPEQWQHAADVLEKELGFDAQNRIIVLHDKKGKLHAHIVWQREKDGRLLSDSHSYKAHDRARATLEQELGHRRTLQPGEAKQELTQLWEASTTGADFQRAAEVRGYRLAREYQTERGATRPYAVETPDGQKLDLARQIVGAKTADLRAKLAAIEESLPRAAELEGRTRVSQPQQKKRGREATNDNQRGQQEPEKSAQGMRPARAADQRKTTLEPSDDKQPEGRSEADRDRQAGKLAEMQRQHKTTQRRAQEAGQTFREVTQAEVRPTAPEPTPATETESEVERRFAEKRQRQTERRAREMGENNPTASDVEARFNRARENREKGEGLEIGV
jgi:hypothetical protein